MSKENQAIRRILFKYDDSIVKKLESIKDYEEYSIEDYFILFNYFHGGFDTNSRMNGLVDKIIDDYTYNIKGRPKPNFDSKNLLDHYPFDFERIFSNYDYFSSHLDNFARYYLPEIEMAKKKILKSGGIFGNPLSTSEVEEFIDLINRAGEIRVDIFRYLVIGCLMNRTFDSLSPKEKIKILKLGGVYVKSLPNVNNAYDYHKLYIASLLFFD